MRFTERSASTISGSIRFRDFWAFPIHRGGMFARNLKNLRTAEPELDTKSLASRGIAGRLRISNPRTTLPRNQDYCAYQSECGDHLVHDRHCVEVQRCRQAGPNQIEHLSMCNRLLNVNNPDISLPRLLPVCPLSVQNQKKQ